MQIDSTDPKGWLAGVLAGLIGILVSVLGWIWARVIGQQDRHELRLIELEKNMATKGDIAYLADQVRNNGQRSDDQSSQILRMLAERR